VTAAAPAPDDAVLLARDLSVRRGGKTLVAVEELALRGGEVHVLLGPNGAGKSTLLQALNGLEQADGELIFGGRPVRRRGGRLALRRATAAVFQKPHLLNTTVRANVESGLRLRGVARHEARRRAAGALDLLGVAHLAGRRPVKLSGGEAQRVSIARALAVDPAVLFLDEPLASLDPPTRRGLTDDLLRIFERSSMAVIWVTHDRDEALTVGDVITYLEDGAVIQTGPALDVFSRPATTSFAEFLGLDTFLKGRVISGSDGTTRLGLDSGVELYCAEAPDGPAVVAIAPEDVVLFARRPEEHAASLRNVLEGTVKAVAPFGRLLRVDIQADGLELGALITRAASDDLGLTVGGDIVAAFKASAVHPLSRHERRDEGTVKSERGG
jgi:tungstate transport system ATP-binding protein